MSSPVLRIGFNGSVLTNPEIRGLTRYTTQLLRALSQRDDVAIFLFSPLELHPAHLEGVRATTVVFSAPRETVWVDWALPRKVRELGLDVFHAPAERGIPLLKPCPLVLTVHNSYERTHWREVYPGLKEKLWYWKFEAVNYTRADVIITVSDVARNELIQWKIAREGQARRVYLRPLRNFIRVRRLSTLRLLGNTRSIHLISCTSAAITCGRILTRWCKHSTLPNCRIILS